MLASATVVLALTGLAVWQWKRRPWIAVAWVFYVVTLLPVLSLLRLDRQQYVADHHSYLATLPIALLVGTAWIILNERNARRALMICTAILTVLGGLSLNQATTWSDSHTLWSRTVAAQPLSIIAHNNLGRALAANDPTAAIASFEQAVTLYPNYTQAHYNLGSLQMRMGFLTVAESSLRTAVDQQPLFALAQNALGNCLLRQDRAAEAVPHYEAALESAPDYADAHYNLGVALEYLGNSLRAVYHYRQAADLDHLNADAISAIQRLSKN